MGGAHLRASDSCSHKLHKKERQITHEDGFFDSIQVFCPLPSAEGCICRYLMRSSQGCQPCRENSDSLLLRLLTFFDVANGARMAVGLQVDKGGMRIRPWHIAAG